METSVTPHPKFYRGWSDHVTVYKVIKIVAITWVLIFFKVIKRTRCRRLRKERAKRRREWKEVRIRNQLEEEELKFVSSMKGSSSSRLEPELSIFTRSGP